MKEYLAVVHGHLEQKEQLLQYPKLDMTFEQLKQALVDLESQQRRDQIRKQRKGNTFAGFAPPFQIYQKWKGNRKRKYRKDCGDDEDTAAMCFEVEQRLLKAIDEKLSNEDRDTIRNTPWPDLKANHRSLIELFREASNEYNSEVKARMMTSKKKQEEANNDGKKTIEFSKLPRLFRLNGTSDDTFFIHAGLAQRKDSFAMRIQEGNASDNAKDYQLAVTKCTVLERTRWKGDRGQATDDDALKISRVKLELLTGRRHQLRCHMLVAGSPIVGDVTYSKEEHLSSVVCPRMCLHAHRLVLPDCSVDVTAPDPFDELLATPGTGS
eukprot:CAMPEP_0194037878 /NCGR_PEP_ID=MMETSP0009_2-20130614/10202_1 /TAXON_ID=210454 /ORGANISM="Grammatophora oceanica, Strain CCMP 410" /LENGTH=323 /DNA_ID=CAMNT_0038680213 /DNA_START=9 /DNA_END=980 /DNA_ORIENTATION=-